MDTLLEIELKDALAAPDCAVCRIGERAAVRYLRTVLHEAVNDVATRRRLLGAWGFCRRHAWYFQRLEAATMRDGLSTAILGEGLVEALRLALDGAPSRPRGPRGEHQRHLRRLREGLDPTGECPACFQQGQHEGYGISILLRLLGDTTWRERVAASAGLCLPHLRAAAKQVPGPEELEWLLADHRRRLGALLDDLKEYIRKHDYRFVSEPPGRERDAFLRATASLAGTWFELPRAPGDDDSAPGGA